MTHLGDLTFLVPSRGLLACPSLCHSQEHTPALGPWHSPCPLPGALPRGLVSTSG